MNEKDLENFRRLLQEKRISILRDLGLLESHSMNATTSDASGGPVYSDHMPELGSDSIEREKAFMFASRDGMYLLQLQDALKRIENGTFGVCRICGKEIPVERMEAVPTATTCVPCKRTQQQEEDRKSA